MHSQPLVQFTLFGKELSITLYGICIAVGLVVCLIVLKLYTDKRKMKLQVQDFIFFVGILAIALGFVGAMLFQSVYNYIETGKWTFGAITAMGGFISGAAVFIAAYFGIGHFYSGSGELVYEYYWNNDLYAVNESSVIEDMGLPTDEYGLLMVG